MLEALSHVRLGDYLNLRTAMEFYRDGLKFLLNQKPAVVIDVTNLSVKTQSLEELIVACAT